MFSEELSEEDGKAAWGEYREQITKYDNATYYGALQTQWDAIVQPSDIVSYLDTGTSTGPSTTKAAGTGQNAAAQPHHANDLLTVLSNTNRNVQSLIQYLREKDSLATTLVDCQRHRVPVSPNLTAMLAENGKNITTHYALVEEGVRRVNSTLHKCHLGQLHLEPGANKLANELRSKLIKSLTFFALDLRNQERMKWGVVKVCLCSIRLLFCSIPTKWHRPIQGRVLLMKQELNFHQKERIETIPYNHK